MSKLSLLYPQDKMSESISKPLLRTISAVTLHDLGLESTIRKLTPDEGEQQMILHVMSQMTDDPDTARYRGEIFADLYAHPSLRDELISILDKINFLRDYGAFRREYDDSASIWDLMHRLDGIKDYILCVEAIHSCLSTEKLHSAGLRDLLKSVDEIYEDNAFGALKEDIAHLRADTSTLKSVTLGVNLNERFEACGVGLVSINNKAFTKSSVLANFSDRISAKDAIQDSNEWKENYRFRPFGASSDRIGASLERLALATNPLLYFGVAGIPRGDVAVDVTSYMDRLTNSLLSNVVRKLKQTLNKYVTITITDITDLIPEFIYYIRWAQYIENLQKQGFLFCQASISAEDADKRIMQAKGFYNLKLISEGKESPQTIVPNDLVFDREHRVYVLTGANRGGKTTLTQAVGQLFVLAQGGIFVPGESFVFHPVDCIYTHFPADEDKTLDLGRFGEECRRFRELFLSSTSASLLLLNETFSTTSFEEGYYIAKDSVRAILKKGVRTIYNTHMHKLALELDEINRESKDLKAASLVAVTEDGQRSFKFVVSQPQGMSFAHDIAVKYGVTYEMLTGESG